MLLHDWDTVYADSHYSAADAEAGIELQDAEPARPPGARGRPRGRPVAVAPLAVFPPDISRRFNQCTLEVRNETTIQTSILPFLINVCGSQIISSIPQTIQELGVLLFLVTFCSR